MTRMFALDLSKWDGIVDFDALEAEAVFLRAGYGYNKDSKFDEYIGLAKAARKFIFTYFYFYPNLSYETQATNYYNIINPYSSFIESPHCDFETTGGLLPASQALTKAHSFCLRCDSLMSRTCDIYTSLGFWKSVSGTSATWVNTEKRKLWVAQWPLDLNPEVKSLLPQFTQEVLQGLHNPNNVPPWIIPTWWQFTAKLTVPGVEAKDVDGDSSIPSREDIMQMYGLEPQPAPEPPANFDELVVRYMNLEHWAITKGYKIP